MKSRAESRAEQSPAHPSRRKLLVSIGAGVASTPLLAANASADPPAEVSARPLSVRQNAGAIDDGHTDVTDPINKLYERAAQVGATVEWETTLGRGFVVSGAGIQVPQGARTAGPGCDIDRSEPALRGAFLLPKDTATTGLLTLGQPGRQSSSTNPHGSSVRGLGFLGTTPQGANVPGLWGVQVNDTADIAVLDCVALNLDPKGTGGAFFWNSTFQTAFPRPYSSLNARVSRCQVFQCGYGIKGDGVGCTDGKIELFVANACQTSISLGLTAGGGGWELCPGTHLTGSGNQYHLYLGPTVRNMRCTGVYFDVAGRWQINCLGTGLQCDNCYFLYGKQQAPEGGVAYTPINLASTTPTGPDCAIRGCRFNVNGANVPVQGFVRVGTTGDPYSLLFEGNTATNFGAPAPVSWLGYVLNSTTPPIALAGSTNGTADFAAANQVAW